MIQLIAFMFTVLLLAQPVAHASCPQAPTLEFSQQERQFVESASHSLLGNRYGKCLYFRDVTFKNGQGQQALVVADDKGRCSGFFRTPLANYMVLVEGGVIIKSADGETYKIELSNAVPKSFYFDGEQIDIENCVK